MSSNDCVHLLYKTTAAAIQKLAKTHAHIHFEYLEHRLEQFSLKHTKTLLETVSLLGVNHLPLGQKLHTSVGLHVGYDPNEQPFSFFCYPDGSWLHMNLSDNTCTFYGKTLLKALFVDTVVTYDHVES